MKNTEYQRNYAMLHKEEKKAYSKKWRDANRLKSREMVKEWSLRNKDRIRNSAYLRTYGITLDEFNSMFSEQNGCCKICGRHQISFKKKLCVDHDHKTNKVRALLCSNCNRLLAYANDNIELFENIIKYLKNYK